MAPGVDPWRAPGEGNALSLQRQGKGFGEQVREPQFWTKEVKRAYEKEGSLGQMGLESKGGKSIFVLNLTGGIWMGHLDGGRGGVACELEKRGVLCFWPRSLNVAFLLESPN